MSETWGGRGRCEISETAKSGTKIIKEISAWSILTDCKYKFNNHEGTHEL
jgi:hypothetical protein